MNSKIFQLFQQGKYKETIELWEKQNHSSKKASPLDPTWVIGALSYLGRRVEAEEFPRDGVNELGRNFYLGLALTRESSYVEAKKKFALNLKLVKNYKDDLSQFFAWQGQGFFNFFSGQHGDLLKYAEKSYRAVLKTKFIRGHAMALDLMAHGLFYSGKIQESFEALDRVISLAKKIDAMSLVSSYEVSKACYHAQISAQPENAILMLQKVLDDLMAQDTFSKNSIQLEILRQLIHAGKFSESHELFGQISPEIYRSKNRRQIATLLHRYAFLLNLQGSNMEALTVLRSARMHLDDQVDQLHVLRSFALEREILKNQKHFDQKSFDEANQIVDRLQKETSTFIGLRIHSRLTGLKSMTITRGQDPLGDLLDQIKISPMKTLKQMVTFGLWGLIPRSMGWDPHSSRIILDVDNLHALIQIRDQCQLSARPLKGLSRKIIELMSQGENFSKKELIEKIWGYEYDSLRHDQIVHTAIHQLREHLGAGSDVIIVTTEGFKLIVPVFSLLETHDHTRNLNKFSNLGLSESGSQNSGPKLELNLPVEYNDLNARQINLLRSLSVGSFIDIRHYCQLYKVSHMTAFRDLVSLSNKKNILRRVGKGRSTCYIRIK